jgi:hypothetical protein
MAKPVMLVRITKRALGALLLIGALYEVGSLFIGALGSGGRTDAAPGVVLTAPPGFRIEESGELARSEAAQRLTSLLAAAPNSARLGIHFRSDGFERYWLMDRGDPAAVQLVELTAGPSGTRVETRFTGELDRRLAWAAAHGRLDAPGAPAGESRNLYH